MTLIQKQNMTHKATRKRIRNHCSRHFAQDLTNNASKTATITNGSLLSNNRPVARSRLSRTFFFGMVLSNGWLGSCPGAAIKTYALQPTMHPSAVASLSCVSPQVSPLTLNVWAVRQLPGFFSSPKLSHTRTAQT